MLRNAAEIVFPRWTLQPASAARYHSCRSNLRHSITTPSRTFSSDRSFSALSERSLSTACKTADEEGVECMPNSLHTGVPFWKKIVRWKHVEQVDFLRYRWQVANTIESSIEKRSKLLAFLDENVPDAVPSRAPSLSTTTAKSDYLADVEAGLKAASMSVRLTPYLLGIIDWSDPINDPVAIQFIPLASRMLDDYSLAHLDSLHEEKDSPVKGLVHRYPDKVLFLATSVCPVYCRFCTRSYAVGAHTDAVTKSSIRSGLRQREAMFQYIEQNPAVQDVVVSGGDSYYLQPDQLTAIGERLLSMRNVKRIRIASKGLAACPMRIIDQTDEWADALINLSNYGRRIGKSVSLHTHFNHPKEITWITELAARRLFAEGVIVRNQTVLLRGVNDDVETMMGLIRGLADINISPYYVYQGDMVKGLDDLRTPLSTILDLEKHIRGRIAGFMTPSFVVDLPGGGGKRLATSYESYDEATGISSWKAPGVAGDNTVFEYHDPAV